MFELNYYEKAILDLLKQYVIMQNCDDNHDENLENFLQSFMAIKETINNDYGDVFPHLLELKE